MSVHCDRHPVAIIILGHEDPIFFRFVHPFTAATFVDIPDKFRGHSFGHCLKAAEKICDCLLVTPNSVALHRNRSNSFRSRDRPTGLLECVRSQRHPEPVFNLVEQHPVRHGYLLLEALVHRILNVTEPLVGEKRRTVERLRSGIKSRGMIDDLMFVDRDKCGDLFDGKGFLSRSFAHKDTGESHLALHCFGFRSCGLVLSGSLSSGIAGLSSQKGFAMGTDSGERKRAREGEGPEKSIFQYFSGGEPIYPIVN
jgi:hypothetical protein